MALRRQPFKGYAFVDYATQGYSALVGLLVLLFHNDTVPRWEWILLAHVAGLLTVHLMLGRYAARASNQPLDFIRHFYPVFFYIWFFGETGYLNRMFFRQYLDPLVIRCDQALFGNQPSILWMNKVPYLFLSELLYAAYFSYYLMIGGVGLALFIRQRKQFFHFVSVVSFIFYICYIVYIVVPVIGPPVFLRNIPGYTLPDDLQMLAGYASYPESIQAGVFYKLMKWIYQVFEAPGAAIPSSHVAIAICTV